MKKEERKKMETGITIVAIIVIATAFAGLCEGLRRFDIKGGKIKRLSEKLF